MPTNLALILAFALFIIGVIGVLSRRNYIVVLLSIELMFVAASMNFVTFAKLWGNDIGHVFVIFLIVVAAGEVAVGLGILIAFFRIKKTINVDEVAELKG